MISVQTALRKVTSAVKTLDAETVNLIESLGRVLVQDVYSDSDIPGFDNSAMDGYAV